MASSRILDVIKSSIEVKTAILNDTSFHQRLQMAVDWATTTFQNDGKILFCGNGGSAADAQHLAAEFSGRFYKERAPLFAEALHVNGSFLTAVANDYDFQMVYSRAVQAMGKAGDILITISTSGNSENILKAAQTAQRLGVKTIAFTGLTGGKLAAYTDLLLNVPSTDTPRIQEAHIMMGHIICELVEHNLFE
jgi:D-sedoheptulose 7-phosphate isomerase